MIRGSGRRREASESFSSSQNPIGSPGSFSRDDQRAASPPLSLLRRRTDLKQLQIPEDRDKEADEKTANPLGTLKRHPTGPFSALGVSSAPWSTAPQSAGLSPMGSFGNFGLTGQQGGTGERRPGLTSGRSESRFKNLLTKEGGEDGGERGMERKTSTSNLSRVNELESWRPQERSDAMNDLDETDEELPTGSAALAGDTETSPPHTKQTHGVFGTPSRQGPSDEYGFGAFGMTSDTPHGFGQNFLAGRDVFNQASNQQRMSMSMGGNNEPMSPTDTNPYQSPEQHGIDRMAENFDDGSDLHGAHLPGLGGFGADSGHQLAGLGGFGGLPNLGRAPGMPGQAGDRSQTSSAGQTRVFSLGGMGQLAGASGSMAWPASPGGLGTPGRQGSALPNAFGGGIFGPGDMQSPGLGGLGGNNPFGSHPSGFGGGRMGSMFPSGMHEQMRQLDQRQDDRDTNNDKASMGDMSRSSDSPFKGQAFNDGQSIQHQSEQAREGQQGQFGNLAPPGGVSDQGQPGQPGSSASNQPPPPQQRTMVMPDRMRWIYRDPQGQTQGPWSGLEMHDWYKAGFFSPELLVKKYEDPDYEPLAQLIRRIGNSREPFLVPQIGIPHGPPSNNGPNSWAGSGPISTSGPSGGAQPPFASSFPSFGTTLTADQQNALERRKQEEQYLMARQKEHLAQAQFAQRMQMQTGQHQGFMPGQLHHHSSAHSLQSQPSFGSIKSPTAYQPSPVHGAAPDSSAGHVSGFFDNSFRSAPAPGVGAVGAGVDTLGHIREEEMPGLVDRLDIGGNQTGPGQFGGSGQTFAAHELAQQANQDSRNPQVQQMLQDRARLQQEQAQRDATQQSEDGSRATSQRLQQFQQLQGQMNDRFQPAMEASQESSRQSSVSQQGQPQVQETLSLTEQVQKAASAKQSPTPEHPGLPHPFPPAPSQSPLPAPAAQRTGRQSVADQLQTESRDLSQTPSTDTPSAAVAPWAKEPAEAPRGPSLKEIQEAEAKKAAELEEMAAAARRAAFQKEMEAQSMSTAVQPGLPAAATWATGSPITPTGSAAAAWTKTTQKSNGPTGAKSMAQIQKEEEARKKKLAAAALTAQANAMSAAVASSAGGKSYANLAGKVSTSQTSTSASDRAWTTVGASGKTKTPVTVAAPSPTSRTVSTGTVPTLPSTNAPARKAPTRSSTMTNSAAVNAQEEFKKWAVNELRPDLNKGISGSSPCLHPLILMYVLLIMKSQSRTSLRA